MTKSLTLIYIHVIFSTKNREPFIENNIKDELYYCIISSLNHLNSPAILIGGTENHIHILLRLSKNYTISKILEKIKTQSSQWIKTKGISNFYWQEGYGGFSVSTNRVEIVKKYISNQEEHHKKESFEDEIKFLQKIHKLKK